MCCPSCVIGMGVDICCLLTGGAVVTGTDGVGLVIATGETNIGFLLSSLIAGSGVLQVVIVLMPITQIKINGRRKSICVKVVIMYF